MTLDRLRWLLLPAAVVALLAVLFKGPTSGRLGLGVVCALAFYGLSQRKAHSLDQDRFKDGKLGRRS